MQAVKQKLHIKPRLQFPDVLLPKLTGRDPEADKAKLLMGDTLSVSSDIRTSGCPSFHLTCSLLLCAFCTPWATKNVPLYFGTPTPVFLLYWWTLFVPMKQNGGVTEFTTSPYCFLTLPRKTLNNMKRHILKCIRLNHFCTAFAECCSVFVFANYCYGILLTVCCQKIV